MITITGATGQLGQRIISRLLHLGVPNDHIIAAVRSREKAQQFADQGIEVRYAEYDEPESLIEAFRGSQKVLFISSDHQDNEKRIQQHGNVVQGTLEAGVPHIVYTSYIDAHTPSPFSGAVVHETTEKIIRESGLKWTVLRNGAYTEFLAMSAEIALRRNELLSANRAGHVSYVTRNDIARAAAEVLRGGSIHTNHVYVLTGSQSLSQRDITKMLSKRYGNEIKYRQVSWEEYAKEMAMEMNATQQAMSGYRGMIQAIEEGRMAYISDDIDILAGKPPMTVEEWLSQWWSQSWK